eukprot:1183253-Prorocentrum_minimum.AAC.4
MRHAQNAVHDKQHCGASHVIDVPVLEYCVGDAHDGQNIAARLLEAVWVAPLDESANRGLCALLNKIHARGRGTGNAKEWYLYKMVNGRSAGENSNWAAAPPSDHADWVRGPRFMLMLESFALTIPNPGTYPRVE